MDKNNAIISIIKALLLIAILPFFLIWLIWNKTDWRKQNKWIATAVIAVVFLIIFASSGSDKNIKQENASQAEIKNLKNQLETEKQKNLKLEKGNSETQKAEEIKPEIFTVENVVDGDTVKLSNGQVVRYIGMDTPEVSAFESATGCFGKEASQKNEELVEGKEIKMEKDISETDKYGRILRYVWVGDIFVNDYLVRNGFAKASNFPPDEKYKNQFRETEEEARKNKRGMWADGACQEKSEVSNRVITPVPTSVPTPTPIPTSSGGSYACNCSKTCPQMSSCAEAQYQLNTCGCSARDADHDGIACDADCQ